MEANNVLCDSSHGIKSQKDPTSTIHPSNLVQTCGQCHEGATARFAIGKVHVSPETADGQDGAWWGDSVHLRYNKVADGHVDDVGERAWICLDLPVHAVALVKFGCYGLAFLGTVIAGYTLLNLGS